MKTLFLLLLFCLASAAVRHSLMYFVTGSTGIPNFPEFVGGLMVDEMLAGSCDNKKKIVEPKLDWMKKLFESDPRQLEYYNQKCLGDEPNFFITRIKNLMQHFNQSGGVHILQQMTGCEWDEGTGEVDGFNQFGYDGEDFISFDLKSLMWIASKPQAVITKLSWDAETSRLIYNKLYLTEFCLQWLKKYVALAKSSLPKTELPSVSLLQKTPSSPVSCHATGFFPNRAFLIWRKDGEELHEDVELGEILPNHDGTFQINTDLNLSSVAPEDWNKYDCVFQFSDVQDNIVTSLDKDVIRTNWVPPSDSPGAALIGAAVGLLLLAFCITGLFIWRRSNDGFRRASTSDTSSSDKNSASSN